MRTVQSRPSRHRIPCRAVSRMYPMRHIAMRARMGAHRDCRRAGRLGTPARPQARTRAVGCRDACQGERTAFSLFPIICSTFLSSKRCQDCAPERGPLHADVRSCWEWRTWYSRQLPSFGNTTPNPSQIQTKLAAHEIQIAAWGAPRAHSALLIQEASPCRARCKHLAARLADGLAVHLAFDNLY